MSIYVEHASLKHKLKKLKDVLISSPVNDQVLTYDATAKKWKNKASPGVGNFGKGARAYKTAAQTIPHNVITKITYEAENFDDLSEFSLDADEFTPLASGRYLVILSVQWANPPDGAALRVLLFSGLTSMATMVLRPGSAGLVHQILTGFFDLVAGTAYSAQVLQTTGVDQSIGAGVAATYCLFMRMQA